MSFNPTEIDEIIRCFEKYLIIREENGKASLTPADITHSSLLYRLLSGLSPLDKAPPLSFSRPDYALGEGKPCLVGSIYEHPGMAYCDKQGNIFELAINQHLGWRWIDKEKGILQYKNGDEYIYRELDKSHGILVIRSSYYEL